MDVIPIVVSADEGRDDDRIIEADPGEKNGVEYAMSMRRRDSWRCILVEWGSEKIGWNLDICWV